MFKPGTAYYYSANGFNLVKEVMEEVTEESFEELAQDLSRTQLKVRWLPLTEILCNFYFHGNRFFFVNFIEGSFQYPQLLIAHNTTHTFLYR